MPVESAMTAPAAKNKRFLIMEKGMIMIRIANIILMP